MSEFNIDIYRDTSTHRLGVGMYQMYGSSIVRVAKTLDIELERVPMFTAQNESIRPLFMLDRPFADGFLPELAIAIANFYGDKVQLPESMRADGQRIATAAHLRDMRALVGKLLKVEMP